MPQWPVPQRSYDIPRDVALLDANVLISLVNDKDGWHRQTVDVIELGEFQWAVSHASLLEAWNFLVGRDKRRDLAYALMTWALTPGKAILVGDAIEPIETAHLYSKKFQVDIVDAGLVDLAHRITTDCKFHPAVHVATYDTSDYLRLFGSSNLAFHVYDMRDASSTTGM